MKILKNLFLGKEGKQNKALCNDFKTLIISFANLLYKIDLDDNDKRLLYKTFKGNKKCFSALNMKKKEFKSRYFKMLLKKHFV